MTVNGPTRHFAGLVAGAALAIGFASASLAAETPAEAKTATALARTEQLLSANDTVLADVRVIGRRTRATDQALRLSTTSASSCAWWRRKPISGGLTGRAMPGTAAARRATRASTCPGGMPTSTSSTACTGA